MKLPNCTMFFRNTRCTCQVLLSMDEFFSSTDFNSQWVDHEMFVTAEGVSFRKTLSKTSYLSFNGWAEPDKNSASQCVRKDYVSQDKSWMKCATWKILVPTTRPGITENLTKPRVVRAIRTYSSDQEDVQMCVEVCFFFVFILPASRSFEIDQMM